MDSNKYWVERGKTYINERRLNGDFYRRQESLFVQALQDSSLKSVVELGCGFGRMTRAMALAMPDCAFLGIDLSPDQLNHAMVYCSGVQNTFFSQQDVLSKEFTTVGYHDAAVCCELLLHLPDEAVAELIPKMLTSVGMLVHDVDLSCKKSDVVAEHCFFHDYYDMYTKLGLSYYTVKSKEQAVIVVRSKHTEAPTVQH